MDKNARFNHLVGFIDGICLFQDEILDSEVEIDKMLYLATKKARALKLSNDDLLAASIIAYDRFKKLEKRKK